MKAVEHTFFSTSNGTFSRTDHMLGHKGRLGKLNGNHTKHLFQLQCYETSDQLREKKLQKKKEKVGHGSLMKSMKK